MRVHIRTVDVMAPADTTIGHCLSDVHFAGTATNVIAAFLAIHPWTFATCSARVRSDGRWKSLLNGQESDKLRHGLMVNASLSTTSGKRAMVCGSGHLGGKTGHMGASVLLRIGGYSLLREFQGPRDDATVRQRDRGCFLFPGDARGACDITAARSSSLSQPMHAHGYTAYRT
ncbi:hypothetical protein BDW62DRAFT_138250 [Aspergillus aurantiobrunneus]